MDVTAAQAVVDRPLRGRRDGDDAGDWRLSLHDQLGERPTLIIFTVPIMLSAYVGGRRAGLLATAISCLGASYFLMSPFHNFRVTSAADRWNMSFLLIAGIAVSFLNEALHRARRQAAIATRDLQTRTAQAKAQQADDARLASEARYRTLLNMRPTASSSPVPRVITLMPIRAYANCWAIPARN